MGDLCSAKSRWFVVAFLVASLSCCMAGHRLALAQTGVSDNNTVQAEDIEGKWYVTYLPGPGRKLEAQPHMTFKPNGSVSGFAGCNIFHGTYELEGASFSFSSGFRMTRKACPDPKGTIERQFLNTKNTVTTMVPKPGHLILLNQANEAVMRLSRQPELVPANAAE